MALLALFDKMYYIFKRRKENLKGLEDIRRSVSGATPGKKHYYRKNE